MDLTYDTIPDDENRYLTLCREKMKRYHVEDPKDPMNELICYEDDLVACTMLANFTAPRKMRMYALW